MHHQEKGVHFFSPGGAKVGKYLQFFTAVFLPPTPHLTQLSKLRRRERESMKE